MIGQNVVTEDNKNKKADWLIKLIHTTEHFNYKLQKQRIPHHW